MIHFLRGAARVGDEEPAGNLVTRDWGLGTVPKTSEERYCPASTRPPE